MRGLKRHNRNDLDDSCRRTLTGAWIETIAEVVKQKRGEGRTLTGAWIETR